MSNIGYVTIGAIDGAKSGAFYDAVFGALGSERKVESGGWISYGVIGPGKSIMDCHTAICPPHDGKEARAGNGIMIAYQGKTPPMRSRPPMPAVSRMAAPTRVGRASGRRKQRRAFTPPICAIPPVTSSACFAWHNQSERSRRP
jgi:catechol 2,3-dioxygenase-like lactoylglutathione lyase family enzyme